MNETAQPPSPSPLCNHLIELARRVKDGEMPAQELRQVAQQRLAELPRVREETMGRIRAEGEAHCRRFADSIALIQDSFTDMEGALRELSRFAETGQEEAYRQAVQRLTQAGISQYTSTSAYQQAELAQGPTEMPLLNLIHRLKDGFFSGQASREDLEAAISGGVKMARTAADEVRAHEPQTDLKANLARSYDQFAEALERVAAALGSGKEATEAALAEAGEYGVSVRGAMEEYNVHATTSGPTRLAHANLILTLADAYHKGGIPLETVARGIEIFRKSLEDLEAELESLASIPTESGRIAEQMEPTRRAFAAHREALDLFDRWLQGEADLYESARQGLIQAAEALADCKEAFDAIGEMEGKVPCVRCGAPNDPSNRACSKCGAQLIVPTGLAAAASTLSFQEGGGGQAAGDLVMTENLMRLFETVNRMAEGRLGADEYEEVLDWFEGLVRENLLGLPAAPTLPREGLTEEQAEQVARAEEQMVQAREDIEVGTQDLLGALATLRNYLDDPDARHLMNGVRQVRDAAVKIQQGERVIDELAQASGAKKGR